MANELVDFVMSLVRDADVASRYAADPDGALAAAGLDGVTSVDVNNLLPVVSDSLAMTAPPVSAFDGAAGNVWTGGAATAAFDAFTPPPADSQGVAHQAVIFGSDDAAAVSDGPSFGTDMQVSTDSPVLPPVVDTSHDAALGWADAGHVHPVDPHVLFEHHTPFGEHSADDHGFSGSELLD